MAMRLAADTPEAVERLQIESWRAMSPQRKAAIVTALTQAMFDVARAGVRHRFPDAAPREQALRLAVVLLGDDLARRVYPDVATLDAR
ncbi:MAG: hypothetical protein FJW14_11440 [Acidimicrobiia bacterium]|nr:hypothetical protein [Acidimicrobiia bacterium]